MREIETKLTLLGFIKVWLIKFIGILTAPFNHKWFYNFCKLFSSIPSKEKYLIIKIFKDCIYEIILKDPYWNRLISSTYHYEPEILFLLDYVKKIKFSFIDGGANWGFWSIVVSSRKFRAVETVSYEPMPNSFLRLQRNCKLNGGRFKVIQKAIGPKSCKNIQLTISKDSEISAVGASINKKTSSRSLSAIVSVVGIDEVLEGLEFKDRVIIKLDLEGVEAQVIKSSKWIDNNDCLIIFEDHGKDLECKVLEVVLAKGWPIYFIHNDGKIVFIKEKRETALLKTNKSKGYNFFATHPDGIFHNILASKLNNNNN